MHPKTRWYNQLTIIKHWWSLGDWNKSYPPHLNIVPTTSQGCWDISSLFIRSIYIIPLKIILCIHRRNGDYNIIVPSNGIFKYCSMYIPSYGITKITPSTNIQALLTRRRLSPKYLRIWINKIGMWAFMGEKMQPGISPHYS